MTTHGRGRGLRVDLWEISATNFRIPYICGMFLSLYLARIRDSLVLVTVCLRESDRQISCPSKNIHTP